MSSTNSSYKGPSSSKILPLPQPGDIISWSGKCAFNHESVLQTLNGRWPGVLNRKRDRKPFLDAKTGQVLPRSELQLEQGLRVLMWRLVPVYLATIKGHKVVLKLYCQDNRAPGEDVRLRDFDFVNDQRLKNEAKREAKAYRALEKAQGSLVPYCYGFYEFALPNGIRCLGQVLEFIEGDSIQEYACSLDVDQELAAYALLRAIYSVLIELHKFGVIHRDAADRNMFMLRPLDPLRPSLLIFDFDIAVTVEMSSSSEDRKVPTTWLDMDKNRMLWFCEHMELLDAHSRWSETEEGKSILQQWDKHPWLLTAEERKPTWVKATSQSKL